MFSSRLAGSIEHTGGVTVSSLGVEAGAARRIVKQEELHQGKDKKEEARRRMQSSKRLGGSLFNVKGARRESAKSKREMFSGFEEEEKETDVGEEEIQLIMRAASEEEFGVSCKDRWWLFKTYENCFVASSLVKWLVDEGQCYDEGEAFERCEEARRRGFIVHVVDPTKRFENTKLFFRFTPRVEERLSSCTRERALSADAAYALEYDSTDSSEGEEDGSHGMFSSSSSSDFGENQLAKEEGPSSVEDAHKSTLGEGLPSTGRVSKSMEERSPAATIASSGNTTVAKEKKARRGDGGSDDNLAKTRQKKKKHRHRRRGSTELVSKPINLRRQTRAQTRRPNKSAAAIAKLGDSAPGSQRKQDEAQQGEGKERVKKQRFHSKSAAPRVSLDHLRRMRDGTLGEESSSEEEVEPANPEEDHHVPTVDDFDFMEVIGVGAYGEVRLARERVTQELFAIKQLDKMRIVKEDKVQEVQREKDLLEMLVHPGIVKLYGTFQDRESLYFVLQYCPNGELLDHIRALGSLSLRCAQFYAAELVLVLEYLHKKGVVHRDLKPENLLIDETMHLRLTDFGTAKQIGTGTRARSGSFVGTAEYVAPELLSKHYSSKESDLWAFGCVLFHMLAGQPPFRGENNYFTFQSISERKFQYPEGFPELGRGIVERLLVLDDRKRLGANGFHEIKDHPFFEGIDWDRLHSTVPPPFKAPEVQVSEKSKMAASMSSIWSKFLLKGDTKETIVHTSTVLKKNNFFTATRKRQLILTDFPRLFYVDPDKMVQKGEIQWSNDLLVEMKTQSYFRVITPHRTYHFDDTEKNAKRWTNAICDTVKKKKSSVPRFGLRATLDEGRKKSSSTTSAQKKSPKRQNKTHRSSANKGKDKDKRNSNDASPPDVPDAGFRSSSPFTSSGPVPITVSSSSATPSQGQSPNKRLSSSRSPKRIVVGLTGQCQTTGRRSSRDLKNKLKRSKGGGKGS